MAWIERMQNGTFEQGADHWRILGNDGSRVVLDPDNPQNHVLHVVATSATEHMHNHLETTLANGARILATKTYRISFRAKWLAGSPQVHSAVLQPAGRDHDSAGHHAAGYSRATEHAATKQYRTNL